MSGKDRIVRTLDVTSSPRVPSPRVAPRTSRPPGSETIGVPASVMSAIDSHSRVPVAPIVGYEAESTVAGRPFFVMRFVDGEVPIESPLYTVEGFFTEATPEQRRACTPDVYRLCAGEIPNVRAITNRLRRQKATRSSASSPTSLKPSSMRFFPNQLVATTTTTA